MNSLLITAHELSEALQGQHPLRVLDCRARLGKPEAGRQMWEAGHVAGSLPVSLDHDLAGPPGAGGRHPLPTPEAFTATLQRLGVSPGEPVVVLDDLGGQLAAARAWWMLAIWAGHPDVRVLDGGLQAWLAAGGELVQAAWQPPEPGRWQPTFNAGAWIGADQVLAGRALLVDARSEERFRGEVEPIDPVAGRIPGAVCRPSAANLDKQGKFKPAQRLDAELPRADQVVAYCGSGVTACHNLLAYAIAGRPVPRLYPGSWSEWITAPARPVARG